MPLDPVSKARTAWVREILTQAKTPIAGFVIFGFLCVALAAITSHASLSDGARAVLLGFDTLLFAADLITLCIMAMRSTQSLIFDQTAHLIYEDQKREIAMTGTVDELQKLREVLPQLVRLLRVLNTEPDALNEVAHDIAVVDRLDFQESITAEKTPAEGSLPGQPSDRSEAGGGATPITPT